MQLYNYASSDKVNAMDNRSLPQQTTFFPNHIVTFYSTT